MTPNEGRPGILRNDITEIRHFWRTGIGSDLTDGQLIAIGRRALYEVPDLIEQMDEVGDRMVEMQLLLQQMIETFSSPEFSILPAD